MCKISKLVSKFLQSYHSWNDPIHIHTISHENRFGALWSALTSLPTTARAKDGALRFRDNLGYFLFETDQI